MLALALVVSSCGSDAPDEPLAARDVAAEAGIQDRTETHGENCVRDLDGDGSLDLILSTHAERAWPLFRGVGDGRFVVDEAVEFERRDRHGCAVADFDQDGLLDVYMSIGACRGTCEGTKELWIQQPDHTFVDRAAEWGIDDPTTRGRVPVVLDVNGDDLPDLFAGQQTGVDAPSPNRLWINRGDHFELQEDAVSNEIGNLCAAGGDVDGDGLDELAVCTPDGLFQMYRNVDGTYVEDTASFGLEEHGRRNIEFVDLDDDGRLDFVWATKGVVEVLLNRDGRFEVVNRYFPADGRDIAFGDVDGDGDLDMYLQQGAETSEADLVLLNTGDGREFEPGPELPDTTGDAGDTVVAIPDWKGTGRAAFLVNNGYNEEPGPRQRQLFEFTGG